MKINPGASGGSPVSRARTAAEPKVELTPARTEARPSDRRAELFRDEFVGGPARSGGTRSPAAAQALSAPSGQQQGGGRTNSVVDSIRDFIRGLFGGGNEGTNNGNGIGPVAQSPGKDQLAQGGPGNKPQEIAVA